VNWEKKLKNVEEGSAGQKLNRKRGISETMLENGQGQGQRGKGDIFVPGPEFYVGPRRSLGKRRKRRKREGEVFPVPAFPLCGLESRK